MPPLTASALMRLVPKSPSFVVQVSFTVVEFVSMTDIPENG